MTTERTDNTLLKHLQEKYPSYPFHFVRREGCITSNWQTLAMVEPRCDGHINICFQAAKAAALGIDQKLAAEATRARGGGRTAASVEWTQV